MENTCDTAWQGLYTPVLLSLDVDLVMVATYEVKTKLRVYATTVLGLRTHLHLLGP